MLTYSRKNSANRIQKDLGKKDFYKVYKKLAVNRMDYQTFNKVLFNKDNGLFAEIIKMLIFEAYIWTLPEYLGKIAITKRKFKINLLSNGEVDLRGRLVDWKATKELWESDDRHKEKKTLVYLRRKDIFCIKWFYTKKYTVFNKSIGYYSFEPVRTLKSYLEQCVKEHYPHKLDFLTNIK